MKRGFTLVEILAVLVIIGLLFGISVVLIYPIINEGRETTHQAQINTILKSAYDYSILHTEILPENNNDFIIPLAQLKYEGLIDTNITDPNTGSPFSDDLIIKISLSEPSEDKEYKKEGDYYYIIDYNDSDNKPTINLESYAATVNIQTSGSYEIPSIDSVKSSSGTDISNYEVYVNIVRGSSIVPSVDITTYGIYNITYTVKVGNIVGSKTISVVVDDNEKPTLETIPSSFENPKTISVNDTINLMNGISCRDNSGKCRIKVEGEVDTSKAGTYTIKYTALDDKGLKSDSIIRIIKVV